MQYELVQGFEDCDLTKAHDGDAGYDLRSIEDTVIAVQEVALVQTAVRIALSKDVVGLVCSRSGLALQNRVVVLNAPGVIDSNYRGQVGVILINFGTSEFVIRRGDRIAQLVLLSLNDNDLVRGVIEDTTSRNQAGFGSSGIS